MWLKNWWKWCPSVKCLGPGGTPRHYASHPDPSCLHMTLLYIVLGSLWVKKDELNMILLNCLMVNIAHNLTHLYPVSCKRDNGKQRKYWSEGFWTGPLISVCVVAGVMHLEPTCMWISFLGVLFEPTCIVRFHVIVQTNFLRYYFYFLPDQAHTHIDN